MEIVAAGSSREETSPSAVRLPPAAFVLSPYHRERSEQSPRAQRVIAHLEPIAEAARSSLHPVPDKFELFELFELFEPFELFELFDLKAKEGSMGCESNHLQSRSTARAAGFWTHPAHGAYV